MAPRGTAIFINCVEIVSNTWVQNSETTRPFGSLLRPANCFCFCFEFLSGLLRQCKSTQKKVTKWNVCEQVRRTYLSRKFRWKSPPPRPSHTCLASSPRFWEPIYIFQIGCTNRSRFSGNQLFCLGRCSGGCPPQCDNLKLSVRWKGSRSALSHARSHW